MLLASAEPAAAHFGVTPGVVPTGATVQLVVELPEVDGSAPTSVVLEGAGIETLLSEPLGGAPAGESRWVVRARVDAPAGPLPIAVRATDADGASFTLRTSLIVVPPEGSGGFPRVAVAIATVLGLALALTLLVVARRRA